MAKLKEKEIWPRWRVEVSKDGKVLFEDRKSWDEFKIPFIGKPMTLILKRRVKERSRQEEKYFHAVVVRMIAAEMTIGMDEAKEFLKNLFLRHEERSPAGFRYYRTLSTTELSDRAYRHFWEQCRDWAALPTGENGLDQDSGIELYIPLPNEVDYEDAY